MQRRMVRSDHSLVSGIPTRQGGEGRRELWRELGKERPRTHGTSHVLDWIEVEVMRGRSDEEQMWGRANYLAVCQRSTQGDWGLGSFKNSA